MTAPPIRIWLETAHHPAHRAGGWAYVRADGAEVTGTAGGDRRVDAEAVALAGVVAALKGVAAGRAVRVMTGSVLIAGVPARLRVAAAGTDAPSENLALWAEAMTALSAPGVEIVRVAVEPKTPGAFAAGWAEFARDKAKGGGFVLPIPKANLAKAGVG